ncbi:TolC family protein [Brachymonas sp.]|uniref:TolC family protein n=1 Tax=Brachymonas sp. TaxID=1936292 RepID=UPI0035B146D1
MTSWQPARPLGALALALATTVTLPAWGQSTPAVTPLPRGQTLTLMQAWQAATQHDRQLDVARADQAAAQTRRDQAAALWKPSVFVNAGAGWGAGSTRMEGAQFSAPGMGPMTQANFATSVTDGTATRWGVTLQQPLFSPARSAQRAQLALSADMGDTAWQAARTDTMLQTAERYLALALAEERVRVLGVQQQSVARTTQEAHERFRLGDAPVTDTHEADAENSGIQAQIAAAMLDLNVRRQALADSTGMASPTALLPTDSTWIARAPSGTLATWLDAAHSRNLQLISLRQALEMARQNVRKQAPMAGMSVDLVAQAGQDKLTGSGDFGSGATTRNTNRMIGVQITIPLYTGGMASAQQQEAIRLREKAQAQLDATQQQIDRQVEAAWWGLQAGQARLQALAQARQAMHSRLDATRMGHTLGDRSTLDLLAAESAHAQSVLALAEARNTQVLNHLRLAALANQLDDALLQQVSQHLTTVPTATTIAAVPPGSNASSRTSSHAARTSAPHRRAARAVPTQGS